MVKSVTLLNGLSNLSNSSVLKVAKNSGRSPTAKNLALPLVLSALTFFALKNGKKSSESCVILSKNNVDLNSIQYSASARLRDLGKYKNEIDYPINSKDSNKFNQVFRS